MRIAFLSGSSCLIEKLRVVLTSIHGFALDEAELPHDSTMLGHIVVDLLARVRFACTLWLLIDSL